MRFQRRKAQSQERAEMPEDESRWTYNKRLVLRRIQSRESTAKRTLWQPCIELQDELEWGLKVVA